MRRKVKARKAAEPDPIYNSDVVSKLVNHVMWDGKKSVARKTVYGAIEEIRKSAKTDNPLAVLEEAIKNAAPTLEIRTRRIGGANYSVPREVNSERRTTLAIRWITNAARAKKGASFAKKLADELVSASKNEGAAIKKRDDTHRMAEANRAFAHFAW